MLEKKDLDLEEAVLVGVITKSQEIDQSTEYLDELEFLTYTAGGKVIKRFTQRLDIPSMPGAHSRMRLRAVSTAFVVKPPTPCRPRSDYTNSRSHASASFPSSVSKSGFSITLPQDSYCRVWVANEH